MACLVSDDSLPTHFDAVPSADAATEHKRSDCSSPAQGGQGMAQDEGVQRRSVHSLQQLQPGGHARHGRRGMQRERLLHVNAAGRPQNEAPVG
jgi:hypothetical protein